MTCIGLTTASEVEATAAAGVGGAFLLEEEEGGGRDSSSSLNVSLEMLVLLLKQAGVAPSSSSYRGPSCCFFAFSSGRCGGGFDSTTFEASGKPFPADGAGVKGLMNPSCCGLDACGTGRPGPFGGGGLWQGESGRSLGDTRPLVALDCS